MKPFQTELPVVSTVFNLSAQSAPDMNDSSSWRDKMSRKLESCPGVVGFDVPQTIHSSGRVVVEPAMTLEALKWLRRRFEVAENIEVSRDHGLAIDILPRSRRPGIKRHKFQGRRAEQFQLQF